MGLWETLTWWPAVVMGWPAVLLGLLLYVAALALRRRTLGVVAVIVWTPFCLYISLYPRILGLGLVALVGNCLGLAALWRGHVGWATVGILPFLALAGLVGSWVLSQ